jgi:L-malate glycosyltransferase
MTRMPPSSAFAIPADAAVAGSEDRRIRLLLLTDTAVLAPGGSERFLLNLASRLPRDRYRITLVQLHGSSMPANGQPARQLPHVQLRALPVHAVYDASGLRAWKALRSMLREEHFDIVQSQHEKADLLNALLPRRAGGVRISNRRDMGFKKSARLGRVFRLLNPRFDRVVAPARQILTGLAECEQLDALRMVWIPNGVDTRRYCPSTYQSRLDSRRALGLDEDAIVFGCVARLTEVKRHADLIEAFARVHQSLPQARLVIIGDGPLLGEIRSHIAALNITGAVTLLNFRDDVDTLLPALDAVVLASSSEGMSNALLEAMACALPVIATAVGGNLHLVQHETTGLLVPPRDPLSLAAAMQTIGRSQHMARRMGMAGRARVEREFSLDAMVHAFDQLYRHLLARP